jgi:hypothetical protein
MTGIRLARMGAALAHTARDHLGRHLVDLPDDPSPRPVPTPLDPLRK